MEPGLIQAYTCEESVGILQVWLGLSSNGACLDLTMSFAQLAVVLSAIILLKHLAKKRIAKWMRRSRPGAVTSMQAQRPGWIDGKPAIYTKVPSRVSHR